MTTSEERLSRLEGVYEHLSTKADVESVRVDLAAVKAEVAAVRTDVEGVKAEVAAVRTDLEGVRNEVAATKSEIATIKVEFEALKVALAQQETRIIKWMVGTVVTGIAATTGVVLAVVRLFEL